MIEFFGDTPDFEVWVGTRTPVVLFSPRRRGLALGEEERQMEDHVYSDLSTVRRAAKRYIARHRVDLGATA